MALDSYHNAVVTGCAADTWVGFEDVEEPVALISELIWYNYNFTCISDGTRFQAGSPYGFGPDMQSSSVYQSKTASCSIAGAPLTTTSLSLLTYVYYTLMPSLTLPISLLSF